VKFPLIGLAVPAVGALGMLLWRWRETRRPLTFRRIVVPPLAMSTGFGMFLYPPTHVPLSWAAAALLAGATLFAWPLIRSSRLTCVEGQVFLQRSRAFLWVLLGLLLVRLLLRHSLEVYLDLWQTGSLFYLLAFGMIVHWRVNMLLRFRRLSAERQSG
jgi:membrane protein CcdC involved in cytochrome C biogenesis